MPQCMMTTCSRAGDGVCAPSRHRHARDALDSSSRTSDAGGLSIACLIVTWIRTKRGLVTL
jgi:hypothetical protein